MNKFTHSYKQLKKDAPVIWDATIKPRILRLNARLHALQEQWKRETDATKKAEIAEEGRKVKEEIKELDG